MIIYKYIDDKILDIISNTSLKFTPRNELNDPFELFPYFEQKKFDDLDLLANIKNEQEYQSEYLESIPSEYLDLMTSEEWLIFEKNTRFLENPYKKIDPNNWHINYFKDLTPHLIELLNKTFGILSLTENPLNIPMWSHYANNNTGFVIGFETDNSFFLEKEYSELLYRNLRNVNYSVKRPIIKETFNPVELFDTLFCKSIHWSDESEWRVVRYLSDADDIMLQDNKKIYLFKFDPSIIKEVIFGLRSNINVRNKIIELMRNNEKFQNILYYQIELDEVDFKLNKKLIFTL